MMTLACTIVGPTHPTITKDVLSSLVFKPAVLKKSTSSEKRHYCTRLANFTPSADNEETKFPDYLKQVTNSEKDIFITVDLNEPSVDRNTF